MMSLWKRSLAARFICFTLLSLMLSQAIVFFISWDEHGQVIRKTAKGEILSRCASLARVLEATPAALQTDILNASNTSTARYWISTNGLKDASAWREEAWERLAQPLPRVSFPGHTTPAEAKLDFARNNPSSGSAASLQWTDLKPEAWPLSRPAKFLYLDDATGMGLAVRLANGAWLNTAFAKPAQDGFWTSQSTVALGLSALLLSIIAVFAARGIAQPLRRLAVAAYRPSDRVVCRCCIFGGSREQGRRSSLHCFHRRGQERDDETGQGKKRAARSPIPPRPENGEQAEQCN